MARPASPARVTAAAAAIVIAAATTLWLMGRVPICRCGTVKLWHGVVYSAENSQHLTDWYTFSHLIHGIAFYAMLWLIARRWPMAYRFIAALAIEAGWEIFENTEFVINRYRSVTIALDYFGDSVVNSVSDILTMAAGFVVAWRLPIAASIGIVAVLEVFVGWAIRDNLTLNVVMLVYPLDVIRRWQTGG